MIRFLDPPERDWVRLRDCRQRSRRRRGQSPLGYRHRRWTPQTRRWIKPSPSSPRPDCWGKMKSESIASPLNFQTPGYGQSSGRSEGRQENVQQIRQGDVKWNAMRRILEHMILKQYGPHAKLDSMYHNPNSTAFPPSLADEKVQYSINLFETDGVPLVIKGETSLESLRVHYRENRAEIEIKDLRPTTQMTNDQTKFRSVERVPATTQPPAQRPMVKIPPATQITWDTERTRIDKLYQEMGPQTASSVPRKKFMPEANLSFGFVPAETGTARILSCGCLESRR